MILKNSFDEFIKKAISVILEVRDKNYNSNYFNCSSNSDIINNRKQNEEIEKLKNDIKNEYIKINTEQIKEYQNLKRFFENKIKEIDMSKIHYNESFQKIINS